ncbi:thrombopoietin receptor isoform X2 [Grus americana]|uniref:thrombopoietin receptor isoform X2 n=1 Tax=Grus americana TaxID=9117 RepID=UPI002407968C|nr:thrombopoietin receptor isoform X2 [Grus americana]
MPSSCWDLATPSPGAGSWGGHGTCTKPGVGAKREKQTLRCWQGCPRTSSASPAPLRTSPASGMRRRMWQVRHATSTTGTAETCPRHARSPRGTAGPAGCGTSASSPARTCGSSSGSTSASWMPPPTRPSTSGTSVWMRSHRPPSEHHSPLGRGCRAALCVMAATTRRLRELLPLRGAVLPCQLPRDTLQHRVGPCWAAPWGPLHPASQQPPHIHGWGSRSFPRNRAGAGPVHHVGGPAGPAAGDEVPHPGAQQARRHLHGWRLGALVTGSGCGDTPLLREDAWQQCEEENVGVQGTYACTFQPRAGSAISVLVNVTRPHMPPTLSYFKEPFWLHQAVLTDAPQVVQATVLQGRLSLQWLPPLEALAEQLDYQVRYAVENSHDWKVLQVPRAARKEVLDLRTGVRYRAQVRAQPSGPWYQGSWSAWSKPVMVDAMADAGWIIPSVTVVPLLFTGVLLGLRCTFPSLYSNVKQKLWPPVPDLHRALGSFLHDSSKHGQANAFYKQPPEEAVLPCLLEVLPGPRGEAGAPPPPPEHAAGRLPSTDIANQSYLLMSGWEPRGPP